MKFLKTLAQRNLCIILFLLCGFSSFGQDTLLLKGNNKKIITTVELNPNFIICVDYPNGNKAFKFSTNEILEIKFNTGEVYKNGNFSKEIIDVSNNINPPNESDIIYFRNGNIISSVITEISTQEIRYKRQNYLDGPAFITSKSDIIMVKYKNGDRELMPEIEKKAEVIPEGEIAFQARKDANDNYSKASAFFTGFACNLLTPIIALIPAAIISSNEPKESNLNYPNPTKYNKSIQYQNEYRKEAHKIKKRNVWGGYGVGVLFNTLVALIIIYR